MITNATVFLSARASMPSRSTCHPFCGRRLKFRTSRFRNSAQSSYKGNPGFGIKILAPGRARVESATSIACVQPDVT